MKHTQAALVVLILVSCDKDGTEHSRGHKHSDIASVAPNSAVREADEDTGAPETSASTEELTAEEAHRALDTAFGELARHTPEEKFIIDFVDRQLDKATEPFPKPRKYLVKRVGEEWAVTVMDLESLRRGGRPTDVTVIVAGEKDRLHVVKMKAR